MNVPSATTPNSRTASAVPTSVATKKRPSILRRDESRQMSVNMAQPSGNAPKLARMLVIAKADPRVMVEAAAAPTGSAMNLRAIKGDKRRQHEYGLAEPRCE